MSHFQQFSSSFLLRTSDEQTNSETQIYTIMENCSYANANREETIWEVRGVINTHYQKVILLLWEVFNHLLEMASAQTLLPLQSCCISTNTINGKYCIVTLTTYIY